MEKEGEEASRIERARRVGLSYGVAWASCTCMYVHTYVCLLHPRDVFPEVAIAYEVKVRLHDSRAT